MRAATNGITLGIVAFLCLAVAPAWADMRGFASALEDGKQPSEFDVQDAGFNAMGHGGVAAGQSRIIFVDSSDRANFLTGVKPGSGLETREQRKVRPAQRPANRPKSQQARTMQSTKARPSGKSIPGEYRTVCVRTCDGYYFPMSFSSSRRQFSRDLRNCQAMCPGTEMQVFFQENDAQMVEEVKEGEEAPDIRNESADMISAANGKPYSEMPTAYLYRRESLARPANCSCNAQGNSEAVAETAPSNEATSSTGPAAAIPAEEPEPAADQKISAEGAANLASIQEKGAVAGTQEIDETTARPIDPERKVRVVGPMFLPDPEGAIDLRGPAKRYVP
jgi:hypothetical protein